MPLLFGCCHFTQRTARRLLAEARAQGGYEAIIVPGVPFRDGHWDPVMKARVCWSFFLYEQGLAQHVVYSGGAVESPYPEAEVMALYARELGIPDGAIFREVNAEHSVENVYYGYQLARQKGFREIALATDPLQSWTVRGFTRRKLGGAVGFLPIVQEELESLEIADPAIDPDPFYRKGHVPLSERETWWERFWGKLGYKIREDLYHPHPADKAPSQRS